MMTLFWIAQAIGVIGLGFAVSSYISKTRMQILNQQFLASLVYVVHFGMLSAWTGVAMNAIVAVRNWVFMRKDDEKWATHPAWLYFFMLASLAVLPFIWEGYISLLPAAAMVIGVYARWQKEAATIRLGTLVGVILWIPYTVFVESYAGTVSNLIILGAVLYGIMKNDRKEKRATNFLGV
jgi:hypothetical protein